MNPYESPAYCGDSRKRGFFLTREDILEISKVACLMVLVGPFPTLYVWVKIYDPKKKWIILLPPLVLVWYVLFIHSAFKLAQAIDWIVTITTKVL